MKGLDLCVRAGLEHLEAPPQTKPYRTQPHRMGLRSGVSLDDIQELLAQTEGETAR